MKKGSRSRQRRDDHVTGENNGHGHTITINHILVALILLVFIVFFEDFKSMVFLDRHPHQESGYKLQDTT